MFKRDVEEGLSLALVQPSFARKYFEIVSRERDDLSQWMGWAKNADSEDFFLNFIKKSLHDYADGKSLTCAMLYHGKVVGNISFNNIDHHLKKAEVGYWMSRAYRGQGLVTKSAAKLIDMAFGEYAMEKVQIAAAVENLASRSVCERLGFKLEGIITRAEDLNGRIVDHAIYGLNRQDCLAI
ncbi:MAG: Putative ribosomal N-acetyltransferase YdaF [Candidatus Celerinatantimonas neptuna]|nr:MAG: Putative ribosomal N-acetyltransferase YdaF [Candidatus Celerinatantimonas neptuna]